jgi:16S rRNA processing protein RimM
VRVELLTDRPEDRFVVGAKLYLEGTSERLTIAEAVPVADGPGWWLKFREIGDRSLAEERLRDVYLEIEDPHEPREPGRWFFHELIGLAVTSTAGEALGEITDIYRAGGAEVFVVRGPRGEFDVPGVQAIVKELAPDEGRMVVDLDNLALDARPVEDEAYVRPRDRRPKKQPKRKPGDAAAKPAETAPTARAPKRPKPGSAASAPSTSSASPEAGPAAGAAPAPAPEAAPAPEPAPDA